MASLLYLAGGLLSLATLGVAKKCTCGDFSGLTLPNIEVLSLDVAVNRTTVAESPGGHSASVRFCQVSIQYTHPGQNDAITTWIGLPLREAKWNGRFLMEGGGGWQAGSPRNVLGPVSNGYTSSSTDGGLNTTATAAEWGMVSEGNVNWPAIIDFSSVALDEAARLGKLATELYFGKGPEYSYWSGCSTGGRRGHMMAQRYPENFDGIVAGCPAFNWHRFVMAEVWPPLLAQFLGKSSL